MSTTYQYISPGVINVTDAEGNTTQLTFTNTGQIESITDPINRVSEFAYDSDDNLSQLTTPDNTVYGFTYDNSGRLLSQTDPLGQAVSFTYGTNSDLPLTITDQRGNITTYNYDTYGNLTGINYEGGTGETFVYDVANQLTTVTERSGDTFQYSYDADRRLTQKLFDDGTFEQYAYDANDNLSSILDVQGGLTTLDYDGDNRLTKITYPTGRFLQYAYDTDGQRTQMVDQDGFTVNYSYDSEGRLQELTDAADSRIVLYEYNAASQLVQETNGNGTYTTYGYDAAGQLTSIINYAPDDSVNSSFSYAYDDLGQQTQAITPEGTWNYTYDATGQLTRAQLASSDPGIANQDLQYTYDAAGNRISTTINGITTNYTRNDLNQYLQVGTAQYTYDLDGNLTQIVDGADTTTYTYSDENRLVGVTTPNGDTWTYEYDALGNRTAVVENGVRTEYLVDPFGLGDVVGEYSGGLIAKYAHGLGLVGRFSARSSNYYDSNYIGSTVGLTNGSGSYINRYAYRPYGENLLTTEGVVNPFEFVGQWGVMDETNGLDFIRARFSSPLDGRFVSADPIGQNGGLNLYAYAANNPLSLVDITGRSPINPLRELESSLQQITNRKTLQRAAEISSVLLGAARIIAIPLGAASVPSLLIAGITLGLLSATVSDTPVQDLGRLAFDNFLRGLGDLAGSLGQLNRWLNRGQDLVDFGDLFLRSSLGDSVSQAMISASQKISPLTLDLDNDGVELVSLEDSTAFFDLDADGFSEQTGWVQSDDGLLAIDLNGDRIINNINELFGNATTDGFEILKALDSNSDNLINSQDTQFADLLIWRDYDQDGYSDIGELRTLNNLDITQIDLNYQTVDLVNEGNTISSTSSYTLQNGETREIVDVWFNLDQVHTLYNEDVDIKAETLYLPSLRGNGELVDLFIAISQDPVLLQTMRELVMLSTVNYQTFHNEFVSKTEDLLFRWAGVENVDINSRGGFYPDARQLEFLEKYTGTPFIQNEGETFESPNPRYQAAKVIQDVWGELFRELLGQLVVQGPLNALFPNTSFNHNLDTLETTATIDTILDNIEASAPTNIDDAVLYWHLAVAGLDAFEDQFGLVQEEYDNLISLALSSFGLNGFVDSLREPDFLQALNQVTLGTAGDDVISGTPDIDWINAGAGNDIINGLDDSDILDGSLGNDEIDGGGGDDILRAGLGFDILDGGAGTDTLALDLTSQVNDLQIIDPASQSRFLLAGIVEAENFELVDITGGQGNDLLSQVSVVNGNIFRSDDVFSGGAGDDTINPGLGVDDTANGGSGTDLLILDYSVDDIHGALEFLLADSDDTGVSGSAGRRGTSFEWIDTLGFSGIERFDIDATNNADGITTWTGDDSLNGRGGDDILDGGGGDDTVNGGEGDDLIIVGLGFDTVDGGTGSDTLLIDLSSQETGFSFAVASPPTLSLPRIVSATNFEYFEVTGSQGDDVIDMTSVTHDIPIKGSQGNDELRTGSGRDRLEGGDGDDILYAGAGSDRRVVRFSTRFDTAGLYGGDGDDQLFGEAGLDELYGENGNDILDGGEDGDSLYGGDGDDQLYGGDGDDFFDPGAGVDFIDGGNGDNDGLFFDYSNLQQAISVTFTGITGSTFDGDTFQNVEQFEIKGSQGQNTIDIRQATGSSRLEGSSSNDLLTSGAGGDLLLGGDGNDTLYGGAGNDSRAVKFFPANPSTGGLYGGTGDDRIFGQDGGDNLYGEEGNDFLDGGSGNDLLDPGTGVDDIEGGAGNDGLYLDLSGFTSQTSVTYSTFTDGSVSNGTTFRNIEAIELVGSDEVDEVDVRRTTESSYIQGNGGNDLIKTGAGRDRIEGGDGDDTLYGGAGSDGGNNKFFPVSIKRGGLYGGTGNDQLFGEEDSDNLYGEDGDDFLDGGSGNDLLDPGTGVDDIDGGAGNDGLYLDLSGFTSQTSVTYSTFTDGSVSNGTTFRNIEAIELVGSDEVDEVDVRRTTESSYIQGNGGNDLIKTGAGRDRIEGGDGDDTLYGGAGSDGGNNKFFPVSIKRGGLYGGAGNDQLFGEEDNDSLYGEGGDDFLDGGSGSDTLEGGDGDDTLIGSTINNSTPNQNEQDILTGGLGSDRFILGDGTWLGYDDEDNTSDGSADYALITDFDETVDIVQLRGSASDYRLETVSGETNLYLEKFGSEPDELIAKFQNVIGLDLLSDAFEYISAPPVIATAFDVVNDHVLSGQVNLTFTLENQSTDTLSGLTTQLIYSDDEIIGNGDDQIVGTQTVSDLLMGESVSDSLTAQLPVDILNSRAQADDAPNLGAGYVSSSVDYVALVTDGGDFLAVDDITYFPWDVDGNGLVSPTDAIFVINRLGQSVSSENALADFDGNGVITPTDAIAAINRLGYSINSTVFNEGSTV